MAVWTSLTRVIRALTARDDSRPAQVRGTFAVGSDADLETLQERMASEDTRIAVEGVDKPQQLKFGQSYAVSILPRVGLGVIAKDLPGLLQGPRARVREPAGFFLLASNESSIDTFGEKSSVTKYRLVLELVAYLEKVAAFLDKGQQQLVFIDSGKFEVPIEYGAAQVNAFPVDGVREVLQAIPKGAHEKQSTKILAAAVVSMTRDLPPAMRFAHLLLNAADLKKRYDEGYDLFVSGFSYDVVHDQVEAARVEYAGKIHKAFGDIQNQLLGIPVATVIVATQMKAVKDLWSYEFWLNTSVLVGCWVFAVLIYLLLRNQTHTLDVLADEIKRQETLIKGTYKDIAGSFANVFKFLNKRLRRQRIVIRVVDGVVVLGLVLAHVVYLALTPPVVASLKHAIY